MNNKQSKTIYKLTDKHNNIKSHYVFLQGGSIGCGAINIMNRLDKYVGFKKQGKYMIVNDLRIFRKYLRGCRYKIRKNTNQESLEVSYIQTIRGEVFKICTNTVHLMNPRHCRYKIREKQIKVYKNKYNRRYIMCDKKKLFIKRGEKYIYHPKDIKIWDSENMMGEVFETTIDEYNMI